MAIRSNSEKRLTICLAITNNIEKAIHYFDCLKSNIMLNFDQEALIIDNKNMSKCLHLASVITNIVITILYVILCS